MLKINVIKAKRLYNEGVPVYVVPCKCRFDFNNMLMRPVKISGDFEKFMNEYSFYNLNYSELGKYAHYYIEG